MNTESSRMHVNNDRETENVWLWKLVMTRYTNCSPKCDPVINKENEMYIIFLMQNIIDVGV